MYAAQCVLFSRSGVPLTPGEAIDSALVAYCNASKRVYLKFVDESQPSPLDPALALLRHVIECGPVAVSVQAFTQAAERSEQLLDYRHGKACRASPSKKPTRRGVPRPEKSVTAKCAATPKNPSL
jgi:hypothetical protein